MAAIPLATVTPGAITTSNSTSTLCLAPPASTTTSATHAQTGSSLTSDTASTSASGSSQPATSSSTGAQNTGPTPCSKQLKRWHKKLGQFNLSITAWLGIGLATGALLVAIYYGAPMYRLAKWTAWKDFRESCINDRGIGLTSAACNVTLQNPTVPPPVVKRRALAFIRSWYTDSSAGALAATVTAGVLMVVAILLLAQRRDGNRPSNALSMARTSIFRIKKSYAYLAMSPEPPLVYIALSPGHGIVAHEASSAHRPTGSECVICVHNLREDKLSDTRSNIQALCGHHAHEGCLVVHIESDGLGCPACGRNLAEPCAQRYSLDGVGLTTEDEAGWSNNWERETQPVRPKDMDDLGFADEDEIPDQHSKAVQSDTSPEYKRLRSALSIAHHAVALEFSNQLEAAIGAYETICRLLKTQVAQDVMLASSNDKDDGPIIALWSIYEYRRQQLQQQQVHDAAEMSSPPQSESGSAPEVPRAPESSEASETPESRAQRRRQLWNLSDPVLMTSGTSKREFGKLEDREIKFLSETGRAKNLKAAYSSEIAYQRSMILM